MLRLPRRIAVSAPVIGLPPDAMMPTNANWDAPVNTSSDNAQVCNTLRPDAVEMAPNETP